jgi:hypothetical protein
MSLEPLNLTEAKARLTADQIDRDLAAVLYGRRAHELITFFYRRTRNADSAAELLAETFASAALRRRSDPDLSVRDADLLRNIAKLELSRYFRHLRVETNSVERVGMEIPRLTQSEIAVLDAELSEAHNLRLGAVA